VPHFVLSWLNNLISSAIPHPVAIPPFGCVLVRTIRSIITSTCPFTSTIYFVSLLTHTAPWTSCPTALLSKKVLLNRQIPFLARNYHIKKSTIVGLFPPPIISTLHPQQLLLKSKLAHPIRCFTCTSLKSSAKQSIASHYRPEEDGTPLLDDDNTTLFQEIIGILRWAVELGRVDIMLDVSLLSSHFSSPREGHLFHALGILSYLHFNPSRSLYMNPMEFNISENRFYQADWTDFYRHSKHLIPDDARSLFR
jgi:hypothetical protein